MRKIVIIVAVIIAAGAAGYYIFGSQKAGQSELSISSVLSTGSMPELAYVPADAVVFSAQIKPIDFPSYLANVGVMYGGIDAEEITALMEDDLDDESGLQFALSIFKKYMEAVKDPATFAAKTGLKTNMRSMFYMVGISPVIRAEVTDEAQFWQIIDAAEKEAEFKHVLRKVNNITYREYVVADEEVKISLLMTVNDGWATVTMTSDKFDSEHLAIALAIAKPAENLVSSGKLKEITEKYQLGADGVGFVSSEQIAKAFTTFDGNQFAKDINLLFGDELAESLTYWRAAACQQDVAEIAAQWPGFFVTSRIDQSQSSKTEMNVKFLVPTSNTTALAALQALRGFIPSNLNGKLNSSLFYMALGSDIAQFAPNLSQLWVSVSNAKFTCAPLIELQEEMKDENPLAPLAVLGMANGLQGVALTINSLEFDAKTEQPKNMDALLSMSATNVRGLFEVMKAFLPPLANIQLPAPGNELDLTKANPYSEEMGVSPKLMATDSHLTIYLGNQAKTEAVALGKEKLTKNGLFAMGIDYSKFFKIMADSAESTGQELPDDIQRIIDSYANLKIKMSMIADVNEQGLVFSNDMLFEK